MRRKILFVKTQAILDYQAGHRTGMELGRSEMYRNIDKLIGEDIRMFRDLREGDTDERNKEVYEAIVDAYEDLRKRMEVER